MITFISHILGLSAIAAQVAIIAGLAYWIFSGKEKRGALAAYMSENGLNMAFIVALTATLGSLFYSQVMRLTPCELCWFQRIFMYPQAVLLAVALWKRDKGAADYSLALSFFGAAISLYHNYIFYSSVFFAPPATTCSASGGGSCLTQYVTEFGYVTIPLMALTAFISIILILTLAKKGKK